MAPNNTVVNQVNILRLVVVRVSIPFYFLPAGGPSSMADANVRFHNDFGNLSN